MRGDTAIGETRPAGAAGRRPLQFTLDGTRLMLALQEAGVDMKKLDLKYLLEGPSPGFEIQEVESRLESARASNYAVNVGVVVEY